jgi:hypothetical protein
LFLLHFSITLPECGRAERLGSGLLSAYARQGKLFGLDFLVFRMIFLSEMVPLVGTRLCKGYE